MLHEMETLLNAYDAGRMPRRQLIGILGGLVATALAPSTSVTRAEDVAGTPPSLVSRGLNHIALRVPNVARAREFYVKHLGLSVLRESNRNCFMACGGNHFVALFRAEKPGLDHYCYTVDDYEPARTVDTLRAAGLEPERHEDRVYFKDADGLTVQISGPWDDYPGRLPARLHGQGWHRRRMRGRRDTIVRRRHLLCRWTVQPAAGEYPTLAPPAALAETRDPGSRHSVSTAANPVVLDDWTHETARSPAIASIDRAVLVRDRRVV